MNRPSLLRILIAVGSAAAGVLHLYQAIDRELPDSMERSFVLSGIAAIAAAVVVLVWNHPFALLAPLAVANAALFGFGLSRTDRAPFDFQESGWTPSPDAAVTVSIEIATAVLCVVALALARSSRSVV
jgi:hypothetical protein